MSHQFRVTVEDLVTGDKQVMEFAPGDYVLIPFAPCRREHITAYPKSGTHVITIRDHRPQAAPREVIEP
ncbi:hypothetical protein Drose_04490 [Dactylosporangium roseum]|uniref:Uncharacterized protein n=1 Tax=Dactylosporangium roseum TaxID=47989 RepID=A0ABY5ZA01_9ACTN|nr:hypothetical protein [Dactylosporangium roseum]UWZ37548.1 hypothetical protein Drose_04490 [Dactylosporangium roseum]